MTFSELKRKAYNEGMTLVPLYILVEDWGGRLFGKERLYRKKDLIEGPIRVLSSDEIRYNFAFPNPLIEPATVKYSPTILKRQILTSRCIIFPGRKTFNGVAWYAQTDRKITVPPFHSFVVDPKGVERSVRLMLWFNRRDVIDAINTEMPKNGMTISFMRELPVPVNETPNDVVEEFVDLNNKRMQLLSGVEMTSSNIRKLIERYDRAGEGNAPA